MRNPAASWLESTASSVCDADAAMKAAESVRRQLGISADVAPHVGLILGSGLGHAADRLIAHGGEVLTYAAIPNMPVTQVSGHSGRLVSGQIHDVSVVMLQGRVHCYEGHSMAEVEFGTRLLHALGIRILIVTNAAGGVKTGFQPGDLMLISDHVRPLSASFFRSGARSPVCGIPDLPGSAGARCAVTPGMQDRLWNDVLRKKAHGVRTALRIHEGLYAMMTGPNYETPAEVRAMRTLGAYAVGMSTVPEALLAASLGMQVLGVSCITNVAAGLSDSPLDHTEVTATANSIERPFVDWLWEVVRVVGGG